MSTHDVIVVGAGLAGLSAARDLAAAGADVLVLEARARAGGRVEQTTTADGRLVQLGGEVVGASHTSYRALVGELGLTLGPSFTDIPGESTWLMNDGRFLGDEMPWMSARDRALYEEIERRFSALAGSVDPDDPWAHPDARALDRISVGDWLRSEGATPDVVRAIWTAFAPSTPTSRGPDPRTASSRGCAKSSRRESVSRRPSDSRQRAC
ncbi:FAD-dependent oxidoreductase [Microcella indica]|uniref:FAD-dependent oxidoreductase n=1 Tax=Microcella indica TaxID=2750620 RepID=UPI0015CF729B